MTSLCDLNIFEKDISQIICNMPYTVNRGSFSFAAKAILVRKYKGSLKMLISWDQFIHFKMWCMLNKCAVIIVPTTYFYCTLYWYIFIVIFYSHGPKSFCPEKCL